MTAERQKDFPTNLQLYLSGGGNRSKSLSNFFRSAKFDRKRLPIEDQNEGFKHKIERQPDIPPVSGGASSAPDHVHDLGEKKQIKTVVGEKTKPKTDVKTDVKTDIRRRLNKQTPAEPRTVIKKPKVRVVQGKVVPNPSRAVQGRAVGRLPSQYRGLTRA